MRGGGWFGLFWDGMDKDGSYIYREPCGRGVGLLVLLLVGVFMVRMGSGFEDEGRKEGRKEADIHVYYNMAWALQAEKYSGLHIAGKLVSCSQSHSPKG